MTILELYIAGGCGEHGRNCFVIQGKKSSVMLDCGLLHGKADPYPRLSDEQIQSIKWLLLSHTHLDHSGAYTWLLERGFKGSVVMSEEASKQLCFFVKDCVFIDKLIPSGESYMLEEGLELSWGRSGHCAGSLWYRICFEGKSILYSGDYIEDTFVYFCDPIRGQEADLAILDCAYGNVNKTSADYCAEFIETLTKVLSEKGKVLLPVPKYGRATELIYFLCQRFPNTPQWLDVHLRGEIKRKEEIAPWIKADLLPELDFFNCGESSHGFFFISDPQLNSPAAQKMAKDFEGAIVLTGNTDEGSKSRELLNSGSAIFTRYPVHIGLRDTELLCEENEFGNVVRFHSEEISC